MVSHYSRLSAEDRQVVARICQWLRPIRLTSEIVARPSWPWPSKYVVIEHLRKEVAYRNEALKPLMSMLAEIAVDEYLEEERLKQA
jgi:hypothetical protein